MTWRQQYAAIFLWALAADAFLVIAIPGLVGYCMVLVVACAFAGVLSVLGDESP